MREQSRSLPDVKVSDAARVVIRYVQDLKYLPGGGEQDGLTYVESCELNRLLWLLALNREKTTD
jgi:hypothetical protein